MFLCDECHDNPDCFYELFRSYGPCESCKRIAGCVDCKDHSCRPKRNGPPPASEPQEEETPPAAKFKYGRKF